MRTDSISAMPLVLHQGILWTNHDLKLWYSVLMHFKKGKTGGKVFAAKAFVQLSPACRFKRILS